MNKITLNAKEIDKLYQLFIKMNESSEYGNERGRPNLSPTQTSRDS
jgi:hypothetical protein